VGILASQIRKVLEDLEGRGKGFKVTEAVVSIPFLPWLYVDDLEDSCEHEGIKYLPLLKDFSHLRSRPGQLLQATVSDSASISKIKNSAGKKRVK
jgi:hypothetical protein